MAFDINLYLKYDKAKYNVVEHLNRQGHYTICYENYGTEDIKALVNQKFIDFLDNKGTYSLEYKDYNLLKKSNIYLQYNIEVEQRPDFKNDKFPYDTISIPYRKRKYKKNNTIFCVVNNDCTYLYYIHSNVLNEKYTLFKNVKKDGKIVREKFYHIPIKFSKIERMLPYKEEVKK